MAKNNLLFLGSPWHAILAKILIHKLNLKVKIIVEYNTEKSLRSIENVLGEDKQYIIKRYHFKHFNLNNFKRPFFEKRKELGKNIVEMLATEHGGPYDEIFLFDLYSPITRLILENVESKSLTKIEDGVLDYLEFMKTKSISQLIKIFFFLSKVSWNTYFDYNLEFFDRYANKRSMMFFNDQYQIKWPGEDLSIYKQDVLDFLVQPDWKPIRSGQKKGALILGQTLYEDFYMGFDQEVEVYVDSISRLNKEGFQVYFKPHPRSAKEKLDRVLTECQGQFDYLDSPFPAEYIMANEKFDLIIGFWSNTVIYSKPLFDVESFSLLPNVLKNLKKRDKKLEKVHNILSNKFAEYYRAL